MNLADHPYVLSLLLGIVEGLTEFLPVSSTAHLRLLKPIVGVSLDDPYWKMYDVVIQLGAILAVALYFRVRIAEFLKTFPRGRLGDRTALTHPLSLVMLAFVVTAVPAFLLSKLISDNLESLLVMGCALLVGGVVMWVVDVYFGKDDPNGGGPMPEETGATSTAGVVGDAEAEQEQHPHELEYAAETGETATMDRMRPWQAVWIGAVQILSAVFPGTSRSMSTIAAGQTAGLTRSAALEFSFFLSIPIMCAACGYDLLKTVRAKPGTDLYLAGGMTGERWGVLLVGFFVSFVVAWFVIAWFMAWVRRRGFVPFAIYRIVIGAAVLIWVLSRRG